MPQISCDWCINPYTHRKCIWGDSDSGIYIYSCNNHKALLDQVVRRNQKKVTAKSRHRTKDRI